MPITLGSTPPSRRLRGLLAAGAALVALSGCSTSFDAQTNAVFDPAAGTNARGGGVDVLNALFVDNADGTGTLSTTLVYNPGEFDDDVELPSTITLNEMTVTTLSEEPIESTLVAGGIVLEPNESVKVGEEPVAIISGDNFTAGDFIWLNLGFDAAAEPVRLQVPVVTREGTDWYDEIAVPTD